jgi:hypothetical protein
MEYVNPYLFSNIYTLLIFNSFHIFSLIVCILSSDTRIIVRICTHAISHLRCCTQDFCFINEDKKVKGAGVPAVQFWKFLLERGDAVEKAIVSSRAVPLVHTTNNTEQIRAALWMASSIQCGHPPDVIEESMTTVIIIASVTGGFALLLLIFIAHVVTSKHAMERNPLKGVDVQKIVQEVHAQILPLTGGKVATYIPELGKVPPELFGIAICTVDGKIFKFGDVDHEFSIQSMSKPLAYAHALSQRGFPHMKTKVNVEPAGGAFDTMEMDDKNRPYKYFFILFRSMLEYMRNIKYYYRYLI